MVSNRKRSACQNAKTRRFVSILHGKKGRVSLPFPFIALQMERNLRMRSQTMLFLIGSTTFFISQPFVLHPFPISIAGLNSIQYTLRYKIGEPLPKRKSIYRNLSSCQIMCYTYSPPPAPIIYLSIHSTVTVHSQTSLLHSTPP